MDNLPLEQIQEINKLDENLQHTETVKTLVCGQEQIIKDIADDKAFNKSKFEEGTEKFKQLSDGLSEVKNEVNDMKSQLADGFKQQREDLAKHLTETKENEITKLNKRLDRNSAIKDGILSALVSGIVLAVIIYFLIPSK